MLIAYGSFYPFDFRADAHPRSQLLDMSPMTRGDLLGNIALFLPFGYLGMVAWRRPPRPLRFLLVVAVSAIYGAAVQWGQLFLPDRDPALRDAVANTIGAAIGALVGAIPLFDVRRLSERQGIRAVPWVLIGAWIGYRLVPFVPSIDRQEWIDSVKPLLTWSPFLWLNVLHDAAAWAAVACLWAAAPFGRLTVRWLPALVLGTFALEVVVVDNVISPENVAGAALGVVLWVLLARLPGRAAIVALLLAAAIVLNGLTPFEARPRPAEFFWLPFKGFLGGDMFKNTTSFFEKLFLCGSLVWLAREAGLRLAVATGVVAVLLAALEAAQTRFLGHTPEITDPLLALLAAVFIATADRPCPQAPPNSLQSGAARRKEDL